ncbi:DUF1573 domain-containing protein [Myxococcota bacterium]|nr:DUF1573 domain-containing protein [Myxococcota bacterium]MBU1433075.1 DUF1573 domain-containing protein [Myxococcota bacterium]MBU1896501.1 DUF1573 domain-containing protein [Myxococcota bacterium]
MRSMSSAALLIWGALALPTLAFAASPPSASQRQPVRGALLLVEQPFFDAGRVQQGDRVKHTFVVKNAGQGILTIKRAKGS